MNSKGFSNVLAFFAVAGALVIVAVLYYQVSGQMKLNKINDVLGSITTPANLQLTKKQCLKGSIDTDAYCDYTYQGPITASAVQQIADQLVQKDFRILSKDTQLNGDQYSDRVFWQLKGWGIFISITGGSKYIHVNGEADAAND